MIFPAWYTFTVAAFLTFVTVYITIANLVPQETETPETFGDLKELEWVFGDLEEI